MLRASFFKVNITLAFEPFESVERPGRASCDSTGAYGFCIRSVCPKGPILVKRIRGKATYVSDL